METPSNLHHRPHRRLLRSKTGCLTCRKRKKKCDEKTPVCGACLRNELSCEKDPTSKGQPAKVAATFSQSSNRSSPSTCASPAEGRGVTSPLGVGSLERPTLRTLENATTGDSSLTWETAYYDPQRGYLSPLRTPDAFNGTSRVETPWLDEEVETSSLTADDTDSLSLDFLNSSQARSVLSRRHVAQDMAHSNSLPMTLDTPIFAPDGVMHSELLSHYLTETSIAISSGATKVNPFVVQLIPLAFSDPLLLQLLLAQAAAHRAEAACSGPSALVKQYADSARTYYTQALRAFRDALGTYLLGNKERLIILALGSLTMCVTEVRSSRDSVCYLG